MAGLGCAEHLIHSPRPEPGQRHHFGRRTRKGDLGLGGPVQQQSRAADAHLIHAVHQCSDNLRWGHFQGEWGNTIVG